MKYSNRSPSAHAYSIYWTYIIAAMTPKRRANGLWRPDAPLAGTAVLDVEAEELDALRVVLEMARVLDAPAEDVFAEDAVDEAAAEASVPVEVDPVDEDAAEEAVPVLVPVLVSVVEAAVAEVGAAVEPPAMENWPE